MNARVYDAAFAAVLSAVALGCMMSAPLGPVEHDAYGYPVDYPIPPRDRYGVCSEHRHPDCHAHKRRYQDEHGDGRIYLWEHGHHRNGPPSPASAQPAEVRLVSEGRHTEAAADPAGNVTSDRVPFVSRIVGIVDRGAEIQIIAQGPIDNFDSFTLEEPPRIVVDFWGALSEVQPANRRSDVGPVAEIQISEQRDKVRVVLALRAEVLSHRIHPTATGLKIVLDVSSANPEPTETAAGRAGPRATGPTLNHSPRSSR